MATDQEKQLQTAIQQRGQEVGEHMESILPFKRSNWLVRLMQGRQFTEPIIVEGDEEDTFTRAWLERRAAKTAADSPLELLVDTVTVDATRTSQANQFGKDPQIAAVYDAEDGFSIREVLGMPQSETMARVRELGSYVFTIGRAELDRELKQAVPIHHQHVLTQ
jgi:hypothetical protein